MKVRVPLAVSFVVLMPLMLLGLMHVNGCTVSTACTQCRISKVTDDAPDGINVHVFFGSSRHTETVVPGIYDRLEYSEPYSLYYTVWGPFESITSVNASMSINGEAAVELPVNVATLNQNRKLNRNGSPLFPGGKIVTLTDGDIETVVITTLMTVVSGGATKNYVITNEYKAETTERTINRWLSRLMSV